MLREKRSHFEQLDTENPGGKTQVVSREVALNGVLCILARRSEYLLDEKNISGGGVWECLTRTNL